MKAMLIAGALLVIPVASDAMCYRLLDRAGETVYQDTAPPWSRELPAPPEARAARSASEARGERLVIANERCLSGAPASRQQSIGEMGNAGIRAIAERSDRVRAERTEQQVIDQRIAQRRAEDAAASRAAQAQADRVAAASRVGIPSLDFRAYCARLAEFGGGSYSTQQYCLERERSALNDLSRMTVDQRAMSYCTRLVQVGESGYSTLKYCLEREMKAKPLIQ